MRTTLGICQKKVRYKTEQEAVAVALCAEVPLRLHHVYRVAGIQAFVQPGREGAACQLANADAKRLAGCGADRVRTPQFHSVDHLTQRQVLARLEAENWRQFGWHVQAHDHCVVAIGSQRAHVQGVEVQSGHGDGLRSA